MSIAEGAEFAGYLIERRLGAGGMGTVYLARHPRLPRYDAVKVLAEDNATDAEFRARFLREAELAAALQHQNLVAVRDRGEFDGKLWIATQYVAGFDAAELLRRAGAGLEPARAVHIIGEAARGLDEVHRAGLLHRDVKPANILVAEEPGQPDRVLVTDFGIARRAEDTATLSAGGLTATLSYVAPEQLAGGRVDHRADVYSLGCTLFQLLTGTVPFPRQTPAAVMYAHLHEPPPRPSSLRPELPAAFDEVITRAMAKDPAHRYPSCGALAAAARDAVAAGQDRPAPDPVGAMPNASSQPPPAADIRPHDALDARASVGISSADPFAVALLPRRSAFGRFIRRRAFLTLTAVLLVGIVTAAAFGASRSDEASTSALVTTSPPPLPPATAWGVHSFIADTFPDLLPAFQFGAGYQELTGCFVYDEKFTTLALDKAAPVAVLGCAGNRDPALTVKAVCNSDRSRILAPLSTDQVEGSRQWQRPTGSGTVQWGTNVGIEKIRIGFLHVFFDDPARSFCRIEVTGGDSGVQLRERWWTDAPL
ncbi:serine/threonine-protein kinase [Nocardia sp. NPDC058705]|uniref:serine/threonine-protein kinase n=1 Tax=Nocardia sp. NPDC058705 TaxID=3346609 RepID=UPI0036C9EA13